MEKEKKDGKVDKIVMNAEIQIFVKEEAEEEKEAEEERDEEVKEDVMGWTVVTRNRKQKRRMVQIFVKMDGARTVPMEVSLDAKVREVARRVLRGGSEDDQDVYVMSDGRVLQVSDDLRSCGVRDGCTMQVVRRLRGGGRSKGKMLNGGKKKSPKKVQQSDQNSKAKSLPEVDVMFEMFARCSRTGVGGLSAETAEAMVGIDDEQTERMLRMIRSSSAEEVGGDPEILIGGIKKFVQERRRRREVQREEEAGEAKKKREKEVRTGRGNAGGEDERCRGNEASGKGKGKVTKARESMRRKEDEEVKERDRRCRARKMRRTSGPQWRLTRWQVAHTPGPRRITEKKKREDRDTSTEMGRLQ